MELTKEQWDIVAAVLPRTKCGPNGRGRPWRDRRHGVQRGALGFADGRAVEGFAAAIRFMPDGASALPTMGAFGRHGNGLAWGWPNTAAGRPLDLKECFVTGRLFRPKGAAGRQDQARQRHQNHGHCGRHGLPLALWTTSASPAEVKLVEATLDARFVPEVPERLIGDKAYDSDGWIKP